MKKRFRIAHGGVLSETLLEADGDAPSGGRYRVKIIAPGQGSSGVYTEENLAASADKFVAGTKMYMNHPTMSEGFERPERSVMDLAGKLLTDAEVGEDGALYAECLVYPSFDAVIREKWEDIGVSINAWTESDFPEGGVVPPFDGVTSVDFVTVAGAGGALLELLESERYQKENQMNKDEVLALINEALTPIVTRLDEAFPPKKDEEEKPEEKSETPEPPVEKPEDEEERKRRAKEAFTDALSAATKLAESGLPEVARARVVSAAAPGVDIAALIEAEKAYLEAAGAPAAGAITEAAETVHVIKNFA